MRRPTVRMIRHPPSAVPAVSATAQATVAQVGAERLAIRPSASSSAATTPTDFWASLAPWLKASAADITHSPPTTGRSQRRVARRQTRRMQRITTRPPRAPSGGETASAISAPSTPTGWHAVHASPEDGAGPALGQRRPDQPADQRVARARRQPGRQVIRFQATAPARPEPITAAATDGSTVTIPPIVSATAAPTSSGPSRLKTGGEHDRLQRPRRPRRDERRDRVRCIVQAVGCREGQREGDRDDEAGFHGGNLDRGIRRLRPRAHRCRT